MNEKLFKLFCSIGFTLEASLKLPEEEKIHKLRKLLEANVRDGNLHCAQEIVKYRLRQPNLTKEQLLIIREKLLEEARNLDLFLETLKLLNQKVTNEELEKFLKVTVTVGLLDASLKIAKMIDRKLTEDELIIILERHKEMEGQECYKQIYNSQETAKKILDLI